MVQVQETEGPIHPLMDIVFGVKIWLKLEDEFLKLQAQQIGPHM